MSNIQTGAERMPHDLSHLGFLAGQIGRLITISTTPVIAGDSFEMRWIKHSVDRFVIVSIFIPKLRLILILNSFLGSSDSLVFSELFHSLAPRPLAARSISDFLLTYLAT